jgi:hypothetical protein
MRIALPFTALLLACTHPATEPSDGPESSRCHSAPALAALEAPWVPLSQEHVDPDEAGFVRLIRFTIDDEAARGHASLVRMSNPETGSALYRSERRTWVLHAEVDGPQDRIVAYAYSDLDRPSDIWIQRSGANHSVRRAGPQPGGDLTRWACNILLESELGETVRFREQRDGMATKKDIRRRLFRTRASTRRPIDLDRLKKGR